MFRFFLMFKKKNKIDDYRVTTTAYFFVYVFFLKILCSKDVFLTVWNLSRLGNIYVCTTWIMGFYLLYFFLLPDVIPFPQTVILTRIYSIITQWFMQLFHGKMKRKLNIFFSHNEIIKIILVYWNLQTTRKKKEFISIKNHFSFHSLKML